MLRNFVWLFLVAWFVLGVVLGLGAMGGLAALAAIAFVAFDPTARAAALKAYRWIDFKTDQIWPPFFGGGIFIGLGIWDGEPVWFLMGLGFLLVLLTIAGVLIERVILRAPLSIWNLPGWIPYGLTQTLIDARHDEYTPRLERASLWTAGLFAIAFTIAKATTVQPAWYWLPVYFLGGMFVGAIWTGLCVNTVQAGANLLTARPEQPETKSTDARPATAEELKEAGLSRDL